MENGSSTARCKSLTKLEVDEKKEEVKYHGVRQRKYGKFSAEIALRTRPKKRKWLGTFGTAEEAARAYDEKAFMSWGHLATLNFPNEYYSQLALQLLQDNRQIREGPKVGRGKNLRRSAAAVGEILGDTASNASTGDASVAGNI